MLTSNITKYTVFRYHPVIKKTFQLQVYRSTILHTSSSCIPGVPTYLQYCRQIGRQFYSPALAMTISKQQYSSTHEPQLGLGKQEYSPTQQLYSRWVPGMPTCLLYLVMSTVIFTSCSWGPGYSNCILYIDKSKSIHLLYIADNYMQVVKSTTQGNKKTAVRDMLFYSIR